MRVPRKWDLVWHCLDCLALVGCHEGTDIPLGKLANVQTRAARHEAHQAFDKLWKGGGLQRREAYAWMAQVLMISAEQAHIGMLSERQCEQLIDEVKRFEHKRRHAGHWKQRERLQKRKRRK